MKTSRLSSIIIATVIVATVGMEAQAQFAPQAPTQPEIPRERRSQPPVGSAPLVAAPIVTVQTAPNQPMPVAVNKCDRLVGTTVENPQGQDLGTIQNVVVDFNNGRIAYCVLKVNDQVSPTPKYLAVPFNAIRPDANGSFLILNTDPNTLAQAQGFDYNNYSTWPSATAPAWGAQPVWTPAPQGIAPSSHEMRRAP